MKVAISQSGVFYQKTKSRMSKKVVQKYYKDSKIFFQYNIYTEIITIISLR